MDSNQLAMWETDNVEYRILKCACGCGETFYQSRVGRVRVYKDDSHKRAAGRKRNAAKQSIGEVVGELLTFLSQSYEGPTVDSMSWLETETAEVLVHLSTSGIDITMLALALNNLHDRYCR